MSCRSKLAAPGLLMLLCLLTSACGSALPLDALDPDAGAIKGTGEDSASATPAGAVGLWKFENNLLDSSGHQNDAETRLPRYVNGLSGRAVHLSGKSELIVPFDESLDAAAGLSLRLWFRMDTPGQNATLISRGDPRNPEEGWSVNLQDGFLVASFATEEGQVESLRISEALIPAGTWLALNTWICFPEHEIGLTLHGDSLISSEVRDGIKGNQLQALVDPIEMGHRFVGDLDEVDLRVPWD